MNFKILMQKISQTRVTLQKQIQANKMAKSMVKMFIFLAILFGSIFAYKFLRILMMPHQTPLPVSVSSTLVKTQEWQSKLRAVGTLRAFQGVDVTTEVVGMVKTIHLTSGSSIEAGAILLELNADAEIAQIKSLQAMVELAKITYERDKSQFAVKAVSQATLDFDRVDLENKEAQLAQQEAIFSKKMIRAPFAGVLGISSINPGHYLNAGDKIVTLQCLDPMYADFSLPQQALSSVKVGQKVILTVDTYPGQKFVGEITSMDPKVDPATRNVQIEATLSNPEHKLYPGMFGEVEIYTGVSQNALVLPQTAISFNPFGEIVYIIQEKGKDGAGKPVLTVKQAFVTVGESREGQTVILKGLKEGEQVVTAGQLKLKNGTAVTVNNSTLAHTDFTPPQDE